MWEYTTRILSKQKSPQPHCLLPLVWLSVWLWLRLFFFFLIVFAGSSLHSGLPPGPAPKPTPFPFLQCESVRFLFGPAETYLYIKLCTSSNHPRLVTVSSAQLCSGHACTHKIHEAVFRRCAGFEAVGSKIDACSSSCLHFPRHSHFPCFSLRRKQIWGWFELFIFSFQPTARRDTVLLVRIMIDSFITMQPGIVVMVAAHIMFNGKVDSFFKLLIHFGIS